MKKIGIVTINDNDNYGNRLQNYAVQNVLHNNLKCEAITLKNHFKLNNKKNFFINILKMIRIEVKKIVKNNKIRLKYFRKFNKNINFSKFIINAFCDYSRKFDYIITGSDQVWKPTFGRMSDVDLLINCPKGKSISFSASFGISKLPETCKSKAAGALKNFKAISVREDAGKKIVEDLTNRKDVEVLVDPTMLLNSEEWDKVSKKPVQLQSSKYILNYFLGDLSEARKQSIEKIAKENECEIINILDTKSPFYQTGPSEFLYLEKNAFLICTDSFHSSVFAILYNRPFVVFNREGSSVNMNSRIETLINKFNLKNREYNEKEITQENLNHDYTEAYEILEKEREKSINFLKNALDINE